MSGNGRGSVRRTGTALVLAVGFLMLVASSASAAFTQSVVKNSSTYELTPSASADYFVWAHDTVRQPRRWNVYGEPTAGGSVFRINASGTIGFGGGIDGTTLIYQQVNPRLGRSDLKLFDLGTKVRSNPPSGVNTLAWEYAPTMDGNYILFGRNKFDLPSSPWKVILFDTVSGKQTALAEGTNRCRCVYPGQVSGDFATFTRCATRCNVFVYTISSKTTSKIPNPSGREQYEGVVAADGTVYYVRGGTGCGQNVKIVSWVSGGPDSGTVIQSLPRGKEGLVNPYVYTDGSSLDHVYYARYVCRTATGDIFVLDES